MHRSANELDKTLARATSVLGKSEYNPGYYMYEMRYYKYKYLTMDRAVGPAGLLLFDMLGLIYW